MRDIPREPSDREEPRVVPEIVGHEIRRDGARQRLKGLSARKTFLAKATRDDIGIRTRFRKPGLRGTRRYCLAEVKKTHEASQYVFAAKRVAGLADGISRHSRLLIVPLD